MVEREDNIARLEHMVKEIKGETFDDLCNSINERYAIPYGSPADPIIIQREYERWKERQASVWDMEQRITRLKLGGSL